MSASDPDLYRLLGIPPTATPAEIRQAYRNRAWRAHPDVAAPTNIGDMASINVAWSVLGDPYRRAAYDRTLEQISTSAGASTDHHGERYWAGCGRPSPILSRSSQRLLRMILMMSILTLVLVVVAVFLIGFGRIGA